MKAILWVGCFVIPLVASLELGILTNHYSPSVELQWSYTDTNIKEYHLYKSVAHRAWKRVSVVYGDENSWLDTSVMHRQNYRYCVQAKYRNGQLSAFSNPVRVVLP